MTRLRNALLSLSAVAAIGSLVLLVAPAGAAQDAPPSGDPRATSYAGNAVDCDDADLPGTVVTVSFTIDPTGRFVTITGVPEGTTLTGVVVKGGDAYNVYLNAPWTALHAPLVGNGKNIPEISHWFACGVTTSPTSPSPTPTGTPTESPTGTPTESPTGTPTESPTGTPTESPTGTPTESPTGTPTESPTGTPTVRPTSPGAPSPTPPAGTLTPPPPGPGQMPGGPGGLPQTGSSSVIPVAGLGLALLLGGLALLLSPATLRRLRRR
ncbi:MAG: hypothetical protein ACJ73E_11540 [Mycobacteriales bacterium]